MDEMGMLDLTPLRGSSHSIDDAGLRGGRGGGGLTLRLRFQTNHKTIIAMGATEVLSRKKGVIVGDDVLKAPYITQSIVQSVMANEMTWIAVRVRPQAQVRYPRNREFPSLPRGFGWLLAGC